MATKANGNAPRIGSLPAGTRSQYINLFVSKSNRMENQLQKTIQERRYALVLKELKRTGVEAKLKKLYDNLALVNEQRAELEKILGNEYSHNSALYADSFDLGVKRVTNHSSFVASIVDSDIVTWVEQLRKIREIQARIEETVLLAQSADTILELGRQIDEVVA
jgi:hypothetical protein